MSGLDFAKLTMFFANWSSSTLLLPCNFFNIASFCSFHFGSIKEMRMCSAISSTGTSSPVIGDTANLVALSPLEAAARSSGFL